MSSIMADTVDKVNQNPGEDEVLEWVHQVMHRSRAALFQTLRQGELALTHMESKVLAFFTARPGATQRELTQHSGRDKAQLARLVKGLRARGLLDGQSDPADRRNLRLAPTPLGLQLQQALRGEARRLEQQAVRDLSEAERAQLLALLRRVHANLDIPRAESARKPARR